METNIQMSLTDFKAKMNKSKINKYKINNNNKTHTKYEFNVKYERYKQDISKDRKLCLGKRLLNLILSYTATPFF